MSGVNKVIILGNLGQDPEIRYMPDGKAVANLSVATSEEWMDKQTGEKKEKTEWHRIIIFGKLAEIAGEYLKKGSKAYFEGRLQTRKWQDQSGQDKYTTEIIANVMQMLGSAQGTSHQSTSANQPSQQQSQPAQAQGFDDFDEDIPF